MRAEEAMSNKFKRIIVTQMCLKNSRILNNWEDKTVSFFFFMKMMQAPGYVERFELEYLKSALKRLQRDREVTSSHLRLISFKCKLAGNKTISISML